MAYKDIMVSVDLGRDSMRRLRVALDLADRFQARVIGVASRDVAPAIVTGSPEVSYIDMLRVEAERAVAEAEKFFKEGAPESEFRGGFEPTSVFLARQARIADLVIVGRHCNADIAISMTASTSDLVMRAGRPLLVLPPDCDHLAAKNVVVAWRETREARRAVSDALPFLEAAEEVYVASLGDQRDEEGAKDIARMLEKRGICAHAIIRDATEGALADELIAVARDHGADLIVAGAYGHSRLREWILGGVTRALLQKSPISCLLTH